MVFAREEDDDDLKIMVSEKELLKDVAENPPFLSTAFGQSKSKFQELSETEVSFSNVAEADQAKLELQEDLEVFSGGTARHRKDPVGQSGGKRG
ncbi:hypothetical protein LOK49_LG08G00288 [Camellia lanceoleosa]|uniref:Uncharacterized protein n=1 Tax=Camellia lanceoleosa TaxID=1840588 RepID=A0ACC0GS69_9ERIC|nr:hypothetical protein LOK49_LG08G00288 [Camellia lanceoleosa]